MLLMFVAWLLIAHNGFVNAFALALFVVGGWLLFVTGTWSRATVKTRRMLRRTGGVAILVVLTASGPSVSTAYNRSAEEHRFAELAEPDTDLQQWRTKYEKLDPQFRRDGWEEAWMRARAERGAAEDDTPPPR
jgi:hypothetical protein